MDNERMIIRLLMMLVLLTACGVSVMLGAAAYFAVALAG